MQKNVLQIHTTSSIGIYTPFLSPENPGRLSCQNELSEDVWLLRECHSESYLLEALLTPLLEVKSQS